MHNYLSHYFEELSRDFYTKTVISVLMSVVAWIEQVYTPFIWAFLFLFCADWVTGIMKSKKNGVKITSRRLRDSVTKLSLYMILLTCVIVVGYVYPDYGKLDIVLYNYYIFTELKSIVENIGEMGVDVSILSKFLKDKK